MTDTMMKDTVADPTLYKAAATSVTSAGITIAQINQYLTAVAIVIAIISGSLAIYRAFKDLKRNKDKK